VPRIIVLTDCETWEEFSEEEKDLKPEIWTISDAALEKLNEGDYPRHLEQSAGEIINVQEVS
jgi:hypothetical protein